MAPLNFGVRVYNIISYTVFWKGVRDCKTLVNSVFPEAQPKEMRNLQGSYSPVHPFKTPCNEFITLKITTFKFPKLIFNQFIRNTRLHFRV